MINDKKVILSFATLLCSYYDVRLEESFCSLLFAEMFFAAKLWCHRIDKKD